MSMNVGGGGDIKADINVTPLVDVMLVLLIIMMIIAPLLQKGVDVRLPIAANTTDKPETQDQVVVGIMTDKSLWVNGVMVNHDDLKTRLDSLFETKKEKLIFIKADQDTPYSAVMDAMDTLRKIGIEDVSLITEKKGAGAGGQGGK
jgi:biopolymer transport protein TolR